MRKIAKYMAMLALAAGFTACNGDYAQPPLEIPDGALSTGAWDNPRQVTNILDGAQGQGIWVTGYIVGWIDTAGGTNNKCDETTCTFTVPATLKSNILMAASPEETDWTKCIPVQLVGGSEPQKALNLQDNPGMLGQLVTVQANVERYFGINTALKGTSAWNAGDLGLEPEPADPDDPSTPDNPDTPAAGSVFFESLKPEAAGFDGWTIDNTTLPEGITYVWQWKEYNGSYYLNGSAFASSTAFAAEAYAISPVIDLTEMKSVTMTFDHAAKFQTTLRDLCGVSVREAGSDSWTSMAIPHWPEANSWKFSNAGNIDLSAFDGKKVEVAFRYKSSDKGADTWEIKNLKLSGVK